MNIPEHLPGIQRVLKDIREHRYVVGSHGRIIPKQTRIHVEAGISGLHRGPLVELQALRLKSVASVELQAAAFIAPDIEKPPRTASRMKRDVAIETDPKAVEVRRQE